MSTGGRLRRVRDLSVAGLWTRGRPEPNAEVTCSERGLSGRRVVTKTSERMLSQGVRHGGGIQ